MIGLVKEGDAEAGCPADTILPHPGRQGIASAAGIASCARHCAALALFILDA